MGPFLPQTALSGEEGDPVRRSFRAIRLPPKTALSGEPSFPWAHMVVVAMNFQTGEGMGSSRRRPLALSCRTDGPNNNQINAELNVSTRGANRRNRGGVNRCRQTARRRATSLGG